MISLLDRFFPSRSPTVRDAVAADVPHLAAIHGRAFARGWEPDEFERLLSDRAVRAHVATLGPRRPPVGFILSHVVPPEAEVLSVAVVTDRRRRGIGRALLSHHLARLAAEGVSTSFLEVEEGNQPARALYERFGYREAGRRRGYYAGGADALLLRRDF
ncbi:ribosomal protein S18-alanine N-acetyltransferase [Xanthobacter autotrophicus]|uniref:ribosomal protein S18-alanine N-acetyltransferase n=1 Tax=Xanthobacter TaxID=279 RepID=UPI0024AA900B|nr:ribosomal protein S18-alanine N-acetyltransferase [Xanthobacter autotrophicus]MDI4665119.1 ribosomal protein S18-alanine N-acetyltransferase [Xanthobacter autotrophicus]